MSKLFVMALALLSAASPVLAQGAQQGQFLALELAGGFVAADGPGEGWQAGALVRPRRWIGFGGDVVRTWHETVAVTTYVGGVRIVTPPLATGGRVFAHVMAGIATGAGENRESDTGYAGVFGGGIDFGPARVVADWVQTGLDFSRLGASNVGSGHFRFTIGGVVPLCLRGCRSYWQDGAYDVSGKN